ncbi:sterol desaturase family protein [Pyxidicoccus caerfyrddinensis]|uniref:sterol desaturase family protein n=1 Tax=Pyxidicoccus caerfyrddinensis TaxID=2709663 RepID=UPI0013DA5D06|nr:sterol desaturase family protein [Pyxidicoccus caerfyrddinensis]
MAHETLAAAYEKTRGLDWLKHWLWNKDIRLRRAGPQALLLAVLSAIALFVELAWHHGALSIPDALTARSVVVFYNVKSLLLADVEAPIASLLITASIARIVFGIVIALADVIFYKRITGRPFDWEAMINFSVVNVVFLLTATFTFMNPALERVLLRYEALVQQVPTLIQLNGTLALVLACFVGDFCFYWSHRWCHKIRLFWNLGHVNHHRSRNLSQLTQSVDPHALILDTAGGKVFVLLLLPLMTRLFALDIRGSGWALIGVMALDAWTDSSHSVTLYHAELRFRALRMVRWLLVTAGVHYTHHSREEQHNISDGCNFGARLTLWDRLFGTYVEPPQYIPDAGLFSDKSDYCRTPLRFLFHPYVRMYQELRQNSPRHWPAIIFGSTSYKPPVPVHSEY